MKIPFATEALLASILGLMTTMFTWFVGLHIAKVAFKAALFATVAIAFYQGFMVASVKVGIEATKAMNAVASNGGVLGEAFQFWQCMMPSDIKQILSTLLTIYFIAGLVKIARIFAVAAATG